MQRGLSRTTTPRKVGDGPAGFALTTTVDTQPFRWDTNLFYERLGLTPESPRIEIVRAYQEAPRETAEQHLYYATAIKVLLKKTRRPLYDRIMLGHFYGDDPALDDSRNTDDDEERLESNAASWAYYADDSVTNDDVMAYDFAPARSMLAHALSDGNDVAYMGLGLTKHDTRWEQIGFLPVLMLGVDFEVTEAYARRVATLLAQS